MTFLNDKDRLELFKTAMRQTQSRFVRSAVPGQQYTQAYDAVYDALGMSKSDKDGRVLPDRDQTLVLEGVEWYLKAKLSPREYVDYSGIRRTRKSSAHRLFLKCPMCEKTIPAGRLHQHAEVHPEAGTRRTIMREADQ